MNTSTVINRRNLLRRMTALSLGIAAAPLFSAGEETSFSLLHKEDPSPIYIPPGEGKKGKVSDMDITFKLNSQQTGGHLGVWESVVQPGELGAPPHYHTQYDELCRVMQGSIFILTGELVTEVKAGGWHLRPRGMVHTFWNSGTVPAVTIDMSIPGGHESYMQDLADLFADGKRPGPGDMNRLAEKHDIHYRYDLLEGIMKKYNVKL